MRGVSESPLPGRRGVRVATDDGSVRVELHLAVDWGASIPQLGRTSRPACASTCFAWPTSTPRAVDVTVDEIGPRP